MLKRFIKGEPLAILGGLFSLILLIWDFRDGRMPARDFFENLFPLLLAMLGRFTVFSPKTVEEKFIQKEQVQPKIAEAAVKTAERLTQVTAGVAGEVTSGAVQVATDVVGDVLQTTTGVATGLVRGLLK